jgi:sarcosine oxidase subunit beta
VASDTLPTDAQVVVIGGGIVGAAVAFHLARAGITDVVVVERDGLAGAASGKPIGGLRAQFSDRLNALLALRSLELYAELGADMDHRRVGYLFLLREAQHVARFEAGVALQNDAGIPSVMLDADEARARCPAIDPDAFVAAAFCPIDGHARPLDAAYAYAADARRRGARVVTGCGVTGIEVRDGEIAAVATTRGTVRTSTVVCAAGAWSRQIGAMAGVELDVTPVRRQIALTGPTSLSTPDLPFTIDFSSTFYFHREGPGLLFGMSDRTETPGFNLETTDTWIPALLEAAERRAPRVAAAGIRGGWAGLYDMSPDHNAIIGEAADVSRFLYATGFSGHGFLQGPATGEILRDLVLERPTFVDVAPLTVERFDGSDLRPELNIV